eukprot:519514-Amphidinium_carterae.2
MQHTRRENGMDDLIEFIYGMPHGVSIVSQPAPIRAQAASTTSVGRYSSSLFCACCAHTG